MKDSVREFEEEAREEADGAEPVHPPMMAACLQVLSTQLAFLKACSAVITHCLTLTEVTRPLQEALDAVCAGCAKSEDAIIDFADAMNDIEASSCGA